MLQFVPLIRLAFFNVDEQDRQQNCSTAREIYYGLPVTIAALIIPIVYSAVCLFSWNIVAIQAIILLIMAILFLVHHRNRQAIAVDAAQEAVQRNIQALRSSTRASNGNSQNGSFHLQFFRYDLHMIFCYPANVFAVRNLNPMIFCRTLQ